MNKPKEEEEEGDVLQKRKSTWLGLDETRGIESSLMRDSQPELAWCRLKLERVLYWLIFHEWSLFSTGAGNGLCPTGVPFLAAASQGIEDKQHFKWRFKQPWYHHIHHCNACDCIQQPGRRKHSLKFERVVTISLCKKATSEIATIELVMGWQWWWRRLGDEDGDG